jgi:hypothetical protein
MRRRMMNSNEWFKHCAQKRGGISADEKKMCSDLAACEKERDHWCSIATRIDEERKAANRILAAIFGGEK